MSEAAHCSAEALRSSQLEQLRTLAAELFPGNRFYSSKLQSAGITFDVASLADFFERFPFTQKEELARDQASNPPFGTNLTYPLERYTRYHQTSGTRGAPLRWLDTAESWESLLECWVEILRAAGVSGKNRIYFAFSFGPFIGFWMAFEAAARLGCLCIPGGGLSSIARVRAILDNGADVLCCTPTYALRLGEVARREGLDLKSGRVRKLLVAGEPGGSIPAVRERLAKEWPGAEVFDHHGMTEVGPVSYQCPRRPGVLHVLEEAYLAEILVPNNTTRTRAGETGELVLTTLQRSGSPLLRYRTGDVVKSPSRRDSPCACGTHELALEGGILGRTDHMLIIRGVNVYPTAVEEIIRGCGGIAEYQVTVEERNALPELSIQIEAESEGGNHPDLVKKLEQAFEAALSLRVPVTVAAPESLPRFEMKARRWVKK